jgi:peptide chain release factor subunit 3
MSKLNPTAFSFVPGQRLTIPQQQLQPLPPPIERPEQTEAPTPPPTISLNIGGTSALPASPQIQYTAHLPPPAAQTVVGEAKPGPQRPPKTEPSAPSKTFSLEKAKTDTNAVAQEVKAVADQAVVEDLYGNSSYPTRTESTLCIQSYPQRRST